MSFRLRGIALAALALLSVPVGSAIAQSAANPIPGIDIIVQKNPGGIVVARTRTDRDGHFSLGRLDPGSYVVSLDSRSLRRAVQGIDPSAEETGSIIGILIGLLVPAVQREAVQREVASAREPFRPGSRAQTIAVPFRVEESPRLAGTASMASRIGYRGTVSLQRGGTAADSSRAATVTGRVTNAQGRPEAAVGRIEIASGDLNADGPAQTSIRPLLDVNAGAGQDSPTAGTPIQGTEIGLEGDPGSLMAGGGRTDAAGNVVVDARNLRTGRYFVFLPAGTPRRGPVRITVSRGNGLALVSAPIGPARGGARSYALDRNGRRLALVIAPGEPLTPVILNLRAFP